MRKPHLAAREVASMASERSQEPERGHRKAQKEGKTVHTEKAVSRYEATLCRTIQARTLFSTSEDVQRLK